MRQPQSTLEADAPFCAGRDTPVNLHISLVHYLNSAPLGWYFLHGPDRHRFRVTLDSPAGCARRLAVGDADVSLIPAIEYQRIADLRIVPGVAVAAFGDVRSVLLVRRRQASNLRSVAVDTSSRTSIALVKLLLRTRMGLEPLFVPHEPRIAAMLEKHDAALLIGDAALQCSPDDYDWLDLAGEWRKWQARPFVFAFWACRSAARLPMDAAGLFADARAWGLERLGEIAAHYARMLDLPVGFLEGYLRDNLEYGMGARHLEGLERFYRLSFEAGLVDRLSPLEFATPP
jgi:chorismate dehydratase